MGLQGRYQCPCCDYYTLHSHGSHEICPVCYWQDDGQGMDRLDEVSGPNHITLRQGRENFNAIGAADHAARSLVVAASERARIRREVRATYG
ncbi:MAG: CPCC family cysteine-rich protein [Planctomycetota bacterium]